MQTLHPHVDIQLVKEAQFQSPKKLLRLISREPYLFLALATRDARQACVYGEGLKKGQVLSFNHQPCACPLEASWIVPAEPNQELWPWGQKFRQLVATLWLHIVYSGAKPSHLEGQMFGHVIRRLPTPNTNFFTSTTFYGWGSHRSYWFNLPQAQIYRCLPNTAGACKQSPCEMKAGNLKKRVPNWTSL